MKTTFIIIALLIFTLFSSFAQQQTIKLKLNKGYEFVFEKIDKNYYLNSENKPMVDRTRAKVYKITVDKVSADNTIDISLKLLENYRDGDSNNGFVNRVDYFYPEFKNENIYIIHTDDMESELCKLEYKFSIDLKTNTIVLTNRSELLEEINDNIRTNSKAARVELINNLNTKKFFIPQELISVLTWFNNSELNDGQTVENSQLKDKLVVRERKANQLSFGDLKTNEIISGKTYKKYWLNTENGMITNYSTIRYDSLSSKNFENRHYNYKFTVEETNFRLKYAQKTAIEKLFVSGKIENPLSNMVHIRILDKPFGIDLKTKTVILDENGEFQTTIEYKNEGFIYIENENNNKYKPPGTYVFYAEPGDSILFASTGDELPWKTTVSGTKTAEANFIQDLRKNIERTKTEPSSPTASGRSNIILDGDLFYGFIRVNDKYLTLGSLAPLFESITKIEKIAEKYNSRLPEKSFKYITNEVKSYFYAGIFNLAGIGARKEFYPEDYKFDEEDILRYQPILDEINILDYYNDFGLYSRKFATQYLAYHFSATNRIRPMYITSSGWSYTGEGELKMQFARMVLTGSPYYREIASTLSDVLIAKNRIGSRVNRTEYMKGVALESFELMIELCNNNEITDEAKQIIRQYQRLQSDHYVPDMELINIDNQAVTLADFKGDKPTIFFLSTNWTNGRYHYDDLAKENPEFNFVMVVEGTNYEQWKDYTKLADPVAKHLLLLTDTATISDLFHKNAVLFVLNKNGEFGGYAKSNQGAIEIARASLEPKKKELNKGQLQLIIIILVSILTALIIGLIIWKWRVRQRFRKEEQKRKLRELELTAIRSQMNPHFLFNALNSVQNLVQQNKGREAHLYLSDFAGLIRKVLNNSEKEEVSLAEELEMIQQYLNLEKLRFDFEFDINVAEEIDSHNTLVPSMLLQPFVENAVIHGLQPKPENRLLKIEITKDGASPLAVQNRLGHSSNGSGIKITIEDNGIGRVAAKKIAKEKNGKGTKLMRERLEILQEKQGEKYTLKIVDLEEGTRVEIVIPEEN